MDQPRFVGTGAESFIETLNSLGVERIFLNPGIDLVPMMATVAGFRAAGKRAPKIIHCAHESVACLTGDGGFIYGCPVATLWGAKAHRAPFLSVLFNNHAYASFKEAISMFYGEGVPVTESNRFEMGIELRNPPDYAGIAAACGAFGLKVEDPSDLMPALRNSIEEVRNGTPAVLDVRI